MDRESLGSGENRSAKQQRCHGALVGPQPTTLRGAGSKMPGTAVGMRLGLALRR